jgi:DNA-binding NtrC family response regulator
LLFVVPDRMRALVVDDDAPLLSTVVSILEQDGIEAEVATSGEAALRCLDRQWFDVVLADVRMPGMGGLELVSRIRARAPTPVVIMTAHASLAIAVEAMRRGACDFVTKPFERDELVAATLRAAQRSPGSGSADDHPIVDESEVMQSFLPLVDRAARSSSRVLIVGESGTGKELVAHRIHQRSERRHHPFVAVNCAAIPDDLLESDLFGHAKGAFTGAVRDKPGRVGLAEGGTLFLDEIGDLAGGVQAKLLRLIQTGRYEPLGDPTPRSANVRFIAATHRDLESMVRDGSFRQDLFFRLNVLTIKVPPLRERRSDLPRLVETFLSELAPAVFTLSDEAWRELERYDWPGNVRELRNLVERLVVYADGPRIEGCLVRQLLHPLGSPRGAPVAVVPPLREDRDGRGERLHDALRRARGNRAQAARLLGISRRTLYRWLDELGPGGSDTP